MNKTTLVWTAIGLADALFWGGAITLIFKQALWVGVLVAVLVFGIVVTTGALCVASGNRREVLYGEKQ